MATVKFGPTVIGLRGTIAGTTFSANGSGPYARAWSKGANPRSTPQSDQRGRLGSIAASWRDLTQVQRDDWIAYALLAAQDLVNSLGETYSASGFNWYVRINDHLELAGEARRVDAPTLTRPLAPIIEQPGTLLYKTGGSANTRVRITGASPNPAFNHYVTARITGEGRSAIAAGFKFQKIDVPDVNRRILFQSPLESSFGTIELLQRMFVDLQSQDSHGQRSPSDTFYTDALA